MKLKVFIFILLLSSVSVLAQKPKDDESLKNLVKQMTNAQTNFQPDALDKILTTDYIEISPVGEFDPREKVLGFYNPEMKPPAAKMSATVEATDFSIRNYGDFAVVITKLNYTMTSEGRSLPPRSIRATIVCRKEKGAWKIASAKYTGIRPPQAPPKSE
jgi:ketosteroid isomerase-like protein